MSEPHIALYRKYRPQTFDDVVGQKEVVTLLREAITKKKIAHAYLFSGGRGTGKTTLARIFARDIGCNPEDIIEIDAASNRGIDEIRELREAVRTAPFSSPYKVYIVDEVHMLTKEAANALLKTLEEPPAHVVFILATTDPLKLPETILSRCQRVILRIPDLATLAARLVYVAEEEGRSLDEKTALLVASHGNGSYRDAIGVLEQVLTSQGKKIVYDDVVAFLGVTNKEELLTLLRAICAKDAKVVYEVCASLEKSNVAPLRAYDDLVEMVRVGLLARIGEGEVVHTDKELLGTLSVLAKEYPYDISSKMVITLLDERRLLEVSSLSPWTAFQAIMVQVSERQTTEHR